MVQEFRTLHLRGEKEGENDFVFKGDLVRSLLYDVIIANFSHVLYCTGSHALFIRKNVSFSFNTNLEYYD